MSWKKSGEWTTGRMTRQGDTDIRKTREEKEN